MPSPKAAFLALVVLAGQFSCAGAGLRAYERPEYLSIKKDLARGWGTWESEDPLAQVHLPDGLSGERLIFRRSRTKARTISPSPRW